MKQEADILLQVSEQAVSRGLGKNGAASWWGREMQKIDKSIEVPAEFGYYECLVLLWKKNYAWKLIVKINNQ